MEFWGQEVKPGASVTCEVGDGFVVHLSQAALGETKKGTESVVVYVNVDDKKLVIGTLSADKHPQFTCDLIFDKDFEISHSSKTTSVFLCGYESILPDMFESDSGEDEDEELETDEIPVKINVTEKPAAKGGEKDTKDDDKKSDGSETSSGTDGISDSDSSDEDDSMSEDDSSDGDDLSSGTDDLDSDDSEEDEDEETPVKAENGKKRAAETALKTPASDKKTKIATPSGKKTGDKKDVHVATPHPAKKGPKTPADSKPKEKAPKTPADSKTKEKSPKSGSHSCKTCSKTFNSAGALDSHQKAKKHEA